MKIKKTYWIIGGLIIIFGGYYWYTKAHPSQTAVQYITAPAEKGTLITSISSSGNVVVDQSGTVDPTITGTVADLAVSVGEKVTKGQFLFNIVNDQLVVTVFQAQSSYQSAVSSVESADASKKSADASYISTKKDSTSTHADKVAAQEKIDAAKAAVISAEQSLISSRVNLNYQRQQAAKRRVNSPIAGTVNAVNIKNGDDLSRISGGNNALAPIIVGDLSTLKAQVQVNEVDISGVSLGQKVTMTFSAMPNLTATGKVEKMDSLGTLSSGVVTYNVTIGFDSLDPRIKPEMSVSANIVTAVKQDVIIVPNGAVKSDSNGNYVQVLINNKPERRSVGIGSSNNTDTEITSGLNVGDNVVTQTITGATAATTSSSTNRGGGIPGLGGLGGNRGGGGFRPPGD